MTTKAQIVNCKSSMMKISKFTMQTTFFILCIPCYILISHNIDIINDLKSIRLIIDIDYVIY